jgi:selenophosphate synthase
MAFIVSIRRDVIDQKFVRLRHLQYSIVDRIKAWRTGRSGSGWALRVTKGFGIGIVSTAIHFHRQ